MFPIMSGGVIFRNAYVFVTKQETIVVQDYLGS